jgi:hypothetical protein
MERDEESMKRHSKALQEKGREMDVPDHPDIHGRPGSD